MDQDYRKSIVCISKYPERGELMLTVFPDYDCRLVDTAEEAGEILPEIKHLVFVFMDSVSPVHDKSSVIRLRRQLPKCCYLILFNENLSQPDGKIYTSWGVNDILNPKMRPTILQSRLAFMETHAGEMLNLTRTFDGSAYEYHISRGKRIFDIVFASAALIVLSPLLLLVTIAIRLESKGKAIYQSQRVGTGYKIFGFYKFRSMYVDADRRLKELESLNQYVDETVEGDVQLRSGQPDSDEILFYSDHAVVTESEYLKERKVAQKKAFVKLQNDPRVTRVGRIIRKLSIDELPQLLNVLKGDMSIIGNRPLPLYEAEKLTTDDYLERFLAPAGLTGLWQVEKRGRNSSMSPEERKQLDIYYARNNNFWMDMKILLKTIPAIVQREDV